MTTSTLTLTAFLLARIEEDEAVARAATPGPWKALETYPNLADGEPGADEPCSYSVGCNPTRIDLDSAGELLFTPLDSWDGVGVNGTVCEWNDYEPNFRDASGDAAHIARHDPARVLADVEAKRRIVEEYVAEVERGPAGEREGFVARHGGVVDAYAAALRILALPYADHPDYDESWRP